MLKIVWLLLSVLLVAIKVSNGWFPCYQGCLQLGIIDMSVSRLECCSACKATVRRSCHSHFLKPPQYQLGGKGKAKFTACQHNPNTFA